MAGMNGGRRQRLDKKTSSLMFLHMTPPHGWKEDSQFHYLRLTLPGFKTQNVTIHMNKYGKLVVRGDRQVSEHKYMSFEETFDAPNNGDLEEASGVFEDDQVYCIAIPKKQQQQQQQQQEQQQQQQQQQQQPQQQQQEQQQQQQHRTGYNKDIKSKERKKPNEINLSPFGEYNRSDSLYKKKISVFIIASALIAVIVGLIVKFRRE